MKKNFLIEKKVDAAMNSISGIEPAVPSAHFYTKVLAKINKNKTATAEKWSAFFLRPTVAFAIICFIIALNAFVLYSRFDGYIPATDQTTLASSDEYNDTVTSLYDLENIKP